MASSPQIPPVLKPITGYLKLATDNERLDPVVAYWCRLYALQAALRIDSKSKESKIFLISIMDQLEKEKKERKDNEAISNEMVAQAHVENYAMKFFEKADAEDRSGKGNKITAKLFFAAYQLFEVLTVFGEISEEITEKQKYAKWRAAYIVKCFKLGQTPLPPEDSEGGPDGNTFGEDEPQPGPADEPASQGYGSISASAAASSPSTAAGVATSAFGAFASTAASSLSALNGTPLSASDLVEAQKYVKYAGSSLQYEDMKTAAMYLEKALSLIKRGQRDN